MTTAPHGQEQNKVRNWASNLEEGTRLQAEKSARSPAVIATGPIALMPDAHVGIGATVGSVIPTKNAIIPAAVGVDIGCGMIATKTSLRAEDLPDSMQPMIDPLTKAVPAGVGKGRINEHGDGTILRNAGMWFDTHPCPHDLTPKQTATALNQLGSLGSGNHFLEVCLDEDNGVWVVLHSGSRGIGNQLAQGHIKLAREMHKKLQTPLEDPDLAYFIQDNPAFDAYIDDMLWAQGYAFQNRQLMMQAALSELAQFVRGFGVIQTINCHHNFSALEFHPSVDPLYAIWITRKGAIRAQVGDLGVIPGSMATGSYIVEGKGVAESYQSCAHGAGRRMSRTRARKELTTESLEKRMEGKAWNQNSKTLLDEHPEAYKDVTQVMEDQSDLVTIKHVLTQVLNYKGV